MSSLDSLSGPISNDTISQLNNLTNSGNSSIMTPELTKKIYDLTDHQLKMANEGKIPLDPGLLKLVDSAMGLQIKQ